MSAAAQTPVPADHPLRKAWDEFQKSEEFANAARWIVRNPNVYMDGGLWAAFEAGWRAAGGTPGDVRAGT